MSKRTIAILSIAAIVLNVIAFVGYGPAFATQLRFCQSSANSMNLIGCLTSAGSAVDIGFVLYLVHDQLALSRIGSGSVR